MSVTVLVVSDGAGECEVSVIVLVVSERGRGRGGGGWTARLVAPHAPACTPKCTATHAPLSHRPGPLVPRVLCPVPKVVGEVEHVGMIAGEVLWIKGVGEC